MMLFEDYLIKRRVELAVYQLENLLAY